MADIKKSLDAFLSSLFVKSFWFLSTTFTLYRVVLLFMTPNWRTCFTILGLIALQLIGFLAFFIYTIHRKRMLELADRDMKMFFQKGSALHEKIISGCELNNITSSDEVKFVSFDNYKKNPDLLLENMVKSEDINIRLLEDKDKPGKCIIEVGFIPIDRNGQILLINRVDHRAEYLKLADNTGKKKKVHSFTVSFSPIPDRFNYGFDKAKIYHREVPETEHKPEFIEVGLAINNWNKGNPKKSYLFFFFFAYYKDLSFDDDTLNKLFCVDGKYFIKDHDKILRAAEIKDFSNNDIHLMKIEKATFNYINYISSKNNGKGIFEFLESQKTSTNNAK